MANALFLPLTKLFTAVESLVYWFSPRPQPSATLPSRAPAQAATARAATPLRVVRVVEPSAPRTVAGRMVISGRLADVCAELDRLAALEAGNEPTALRSAVGWR
ncbi:hypothetical protein [Ramlibacter ginsenosidimutans]|uniref:hypothetical protein n=1 Tax=Ramlibacter ginsenosidimutans TaxID=502333 RepID=UPI00191E74CB|nr:hypothetical protein [Ramlibacter ginsenosidimutans]